LIDGKKEVGAIKPPSPTIEVKDDMVVFPEMEGLNDLIKDIDPNAPAQTLDADDMSKEDLMELQLDTPIGPEGQKSIEDLIEDHEEEFVVDDKDNMVMPNYKEKFRQDAIKAGFIKERKTAFGRPIRTKEEKEVLVMDENGNTVVYDPKEGKKKIEMASMVTVGTFEKRWDQGIVITELPIGRWTESYLIWLKELIKKGDLIGIRTGYTCNTVRFELNGFKGTKSLRGLQLVKLYGLTNMVLLNEDGKPRRYETIVDILEHFFRQRLPFYERRRLGTIENLKEEMENFVQKMRFIQAVLDGLIILFVSGSRKKIPKSQIYGQMDALNIPHEHLVKTNSGNFSDEDIMELQSKIDTILGQIRELENTSAAVMWLKDLKFFEEAYRKMYGLKPSDIESENNGLTEEDIKELRSKEGDENMELSTNDMILHDDPADRDGLVVEDDEIDGFVVEDDGTGNLVVED